ncbi:hypothetical protein [Halorubellus litoreus]|uniref:Uncharacterized protein n=1 Tax=Halorubellus litoreus TaxID=755308 RepID=A0ABD5VEI7_9EURY
MPTYSNNGDRLADGLPEVMPTDRTSGNFKLLDPIGHAFDRVEEDIQVVDEESTIQTANQLPSLEKLSRMVQIRPKSGESKEKFRLRLIAEFQLVTCEGTVNNIIANAATLLNIKPTEVGYDPNSGEPGVELLEIPKSSLDAVEITEAEFIDILNRQTPFGYRVDALFRGTFTYRTSADYNGNVNDPTLGYTNIAGSVGDGTYAGLLTD